MQYTYLLTVTENETDDEVGHIEALTMESLQEQLRKIDGSIKEYEAYKEYEMQREIDRQDEDLAVEEADKKESFYNKVDLAPEQAN